jgi:acetolactate synthase-1/2/3 large subunit
MSTSQPSGDPYASEVPINLPANRQDPEYGSDVVIDMLAALNFDYIALTPGSSFRGIHDSLVNYGRNHRPELILCAHEEIAVALAHGYAKASGRVGGVILHDLVGIQHALMACYNASADRAPVFVLGGAGPADPADRRYIDWLHSANTQSELMRPYSKWTDEPVTLQAVLDSMARAYRISLNAPAGPTYVSIDAGLQEAPLEGPVELPDVTLPRYRPAPPIAAPAEAIEAAADLLIAADMPLIIGGRVGIKAAATRPLVELVELLGAAYQDDRDCVCFPTSHPQNMNGGFRETAETEIRGEADVWLTLDCSDVTNVTGGYAKARGGGYGPGAAGAEEKTRKVIDLSLNDFTLQHWSNIGGAPSPFDVQLLADPLYGLNQLLEEVKRRAEGDAPWRRHADERAKELAERHAALRARQAESLKAHWDERPISVARMIHEVYQAVKDQPWLSAMRNYRCWYEGIWQYDGAGQHMLSNGGGGVGYGPGGALGIALAAREDGRFPFAIMGDGDFTMGPAALWTAAHYKIPLLIVLHNNTSFGNDEEHQIKLAKERARPTENAWIGQRMAAPAVDYATLARSYGAWGEGPVEDPDDLAGVLKRAVAEVAAGGVALVDVRTQLN